MFVRFWRSAGHFGANCLCISREICTVPSLYRPSTDGLIPMERSKDNPHTEILKILCLSMHTLAAKWNKSRIGNSREDVAPRGYILIDIILYNIYDILPTVDERAGTVECRCCAMVCEIMALTHALIV